MTAICASVIIGQPHAAGIPAIPVIPLDILEQLLAAGANSQIIGIFCQTIRRMMFGVQAPPLAPESPVVARVAPESPVSPATSPPASDMRTDSQLAPLSSKERKRLRDKINLRNKRAAARAATRATPASDMRVDSQLAGDSSSDKSDSALPLSLKEDSHSSRERERQSRQESLVSPVKSDMRTDSQLATGRSLPAMREAAGLMTLPLDWQPTEAGATFARERLGDVAAADCLNKFRVYFTEGDGKDERRDARGWHARYRTWVIDERLPFNGAAQRSLPLMGRVGGDSVPIAPAADARVAAADAAAGSDPRWAPVWARLKGDLGEAVAAAWFSNARLADIEDGAAIVALPTKFACSRAEAEFDQRVLRAIVASHPGVTQVRFVTQQRRETG